MIQIKIYGHSRNMKHNQELVAQGRLRADQITRLLVPALLDKSDKLARGKVHRTGNAALCEAGVQEKGQANRQV